MKKQLLLLVMVLLPLVASADAVEIDGIYYNLISKANIAEVTSNPDYYSGDVVIPESVTYEDKNYSVTSIGFMAFRGCSGLTSITIGNSVTSIGEGAFEYCHSLTTVTIGNSVTSIGDYVFRNCKSLTSITIPNSVTSIGTEAFANCSALTSITIPNSVMSIGTSAFSDCSSLTSVTIPNSVTSIGGGAFNNCSELKSITIGNGVTSIGDKAFDGCSSLKKVIVSDIAAWCGIKFSEYHSNPLSYAFHLYSDENTEIKNLVIPNSVTCIESYAFYNCSGLISVAIGNCVTSIGDNSFRGCSCLTSVDIGNSVTSIGEEAFYFCASLTSITIPNSVTSIGYFAFRECSSLTSVNISDIAVWCNIKFEDNPLTYAHHLYLNGEEVKDLIIPNSVTSIGSGAFSGCSDLTSITIPNSVTSIGGGAFSGCSGLTSITIPNSVTSIGGGAFSHCSGLTSITIPNSVTSIGSGTFRDCSGLTSITIPNSVTSIGSGAFEECSGLTSITIPNGVTSIEYYVFRNCKGLTSISIPNSVTSIGTEAFYGCSALTSVTIPNNVKSIREAAFYGCSGLTSVNIGSGINEIYLRAFASCTELTDVYCYAINVPYTKFGVFEDSYIEYATLHVPDGSIDAYSAAEPWKNFKSIVKIEMPKYKLTYMVDGTEYKSYEIEFGATITPEPTPTKEGYTFSGWSEIPETMPDHDVTITGSFTINKYKLTYVVDDAEYKTYEIEFGATITPEPAPTKEGYTFSGWSEIPETMPAHDVTVTGSFSKGEYKLAYMVDGEVYKTISYEFGATITPEPAPIKEGYTFSGWSDIPETMPAHDVTITGSFTINKYKLTYMVDDAEYKTYEVEFGAAITPEPAPTKEGYTFSGWSEIPETMPDHDVTITGSFTINKYKLTYVVDDAEYKTYEIEYGATITPEPAPTKEGYTFSGWSEIPETMPAHDVTVTGSFTKGAYILTYMVDGEVYKTLSYDYGATITPEPAPTKEGYTFSGWSEIPETMPAHDVTVTGTFAINKYKLTYVVDGEEYKSYELEYGATITPEPAPTKEGYTFSGWSEIPETMPAHDVTVTGSFTKGAYILTYMVDGEVYKTVSYDYGATVTPEPAPTKEGYTFSGWSEIPETMPAHDVTVTGSFTINKYKLTYIVDDAEYKSYEIEFGATITPEPAPTKEGYTFSGWSEIPETMPAHDVTVTGSFTKGAYILTYMVDGEVYKTVSYDYGVTITPEPAPTKEGYTFSGWSEIPETMPAHDVTVTGSFTINKYKLTYMVDDAEYKSYEVEYGAAITPEPAPTKEGYTFSGWSEIPETMPAHDVTVIGTFTMDDPVIDNVVYEMTEEGVVVSDGSNSSGDVVVPASIVVNGQSYQVTAIGENAFKDNKEVTSLSIPEGVVKVGAGAFDGCSNLILISIGKDVATIGEKAFANIGTSTNGPKRAGTEALTVKCYPVNVPTTATNAFEGSPINNGLLLVNDNSSTAYKATMPWNQFGTIMGFEEAAGINAVWADDKQVRIYDLNGVRQPEPQKGINIINGKKYVKK